MRDTSASLEPVLSMYGHTSGVKEAICLHRQRKGLPTRTQVLSSGIDQRLLMWTIPGGVVRSVVLPVHAYIQGAQKNESAIR